MFKKNIPLYTLTTANLIYAVSHEFSWLTWLAISLSLIVSIWDILEVTHHRRK